MLDRPSQAGPAALSSGMDKTPQAPPQEWIDALDRADADVAAGRVVDGAAIHSELCASIERMTHSTAPEPKRAARAR